jgi:hypothetical protein
MNRIQGAAEMNLDHPLFGTQAVAEAAGYPLDTFRTKLKRGEFACTSDHRDVESPGIGRSRLFTLRRAINIAITHSLDAIGIPTLTASIIASKFTDIGRAAAAYREGEVPVIQNACELLQDGPTVLVVRNIGNTPTVKIVSKSKLNMSAAGGNGPVVVLELDGIYHRVCTMLGAEAECSIVTVEVE